MQRGDLVAGRFLVEDIAGEGGMSVVFRAHGEQSGGAVALKFLRGATRQADRVRFDREARILSELRHPGIVSYVAHGQAMGGRYLAMEWLEGCTLTQRLRRSDLPWSDAIAIVRQAAATLGAAHARGVVHRDVKPSNLFLVDGRPDRVKVLDFGVAIAASSLVRATHTGLAIGTPAYMSPEQARGLRDLDARSDVFALGSVLFECLAARRAFDGDSALAILGKIALEPSPRLADVLEGVPPELDELVAAMLAKPREERPADGRAVAEALAALPSSAGVGRRAEARATEQLTASEQRLLSVVLARGVVDDDETSTFVPGGAPLSTSPLDPLREVARAFEARLDIIADDTALLTISGASGAANDQAAQAARCALALRRVLAHAPIAVATGRAVITGRSPLGEVIDRAASLLAGDRDAIVLDAVTAGLLGDRFELATDGSDARLLLLRERDSARGGRRLLGRPVQCVGRDRELVTLAALYDECAAEPLAQAVLVTGPSGAGKSTLRDELVARLAESDTPPQVLIGRGDPIAARSPYALLAGALRRTAAMREDEPLEARRVKLRTRVARNVRDTDVERVSTFLGEIVSTPMLDDDTTAPWAEQLASARQNPALMGDQIRRAFEDFIEAECSAQPTLLVLDDLHWGDLPSVQLVDRALRRAEDLPLMVLAIARPDVHDAFPQLWKMRGLHEIRLGGLHRRHCAQLVRRALGEGVDDETVARVVERSAGNPFFLEELIRALADGRGADLPETVLAMLQARLERIEPEARLVLRAGSVFGRVFWRGGVDRLLGSGDDKTLPVSDWLAVLCERELIEQHATSRFRPHDEQQFAFRHALLRDAAYAMLTERDRQLGHRLAGTWLAEAGETDAVVLAEHFERGDNRERARLELGRAAQEALRAGDFSEALAHVARATKLEPAAEQRGRLALVAAEALRWQGRFDESREQAALAAERLRQGSPSWYRAVAEWLTATSRLGEYEQARRWARAAREAQQQDGASSARVGCLCQAARVLFHGGAYESAAELLAESQRVVLADERLDALAVAEVHRLRGAQARHVGDVVGDFDGYSAALEAYQRAGDENNACNARVSVGFALIELGDYARAGELLHDALKRAERMGLSTIATRARQNLALVYAAREDLDAARQALEQAIDESVEQQNVRFANWTRIYLARVELAAGNLERAEQQARQAADELRVTPPARAGALAALAQVLVANGRADEALEAALEAREILERFGGIEEFEALVWIALVETHAALDDQQAARASAERALQRLHEQAERIGEAERPRFLGAVADNARIIELADSYLPESSS